MTPDEIIAEIDAIQIQLDRVMVPHMVQPTPETTQRLHAVALHTSNRLRELKDINDAGISSHEVLTRVQQVSRQLLVGFYGITTE